MKSIDAEYIKQLENIDEKYLEMTKSDILNELQKLLELSKKDNIIEWQIFLMSEILHYEEKYDEALDYTLRAVSMNPKNYYFLSSLATTYYYMDDYKNSLVCFNDAIENNKNYYRAYINRASVYRKLRKYKEAINDANYVINNAKEKTIIYEAQLSLSRTCILSNEIDRAEKILTCLSSNMHDNTELFETLAVCYESKENYSLALKYYKKAKKLCNEKPLSELLERKIRIYEKLEKSESLDPVQEMLSKLNIVSDEDMDLMKKLYEHSDQQEVIKEKYLKDYKNAKKKRKKWMKDNYFLCLKGWSSSTPVFSLGRNMVGKSFKGGGFYIRWNGKGIVIDPGMNFIENFHNAGLYAQDINYVIVTHNHLDHMCDLITIVDLDYQFDLKINYYLDKSTYTEHIKHFEGINLKQNVHSICISEDNETYNKVIYRNNIRMMAFRTIHGCEGSFGVKLEFGTQEGKFILSYTSDTSFYDKLVNYLEGSDVIVANFSETNKEDLFLNKFKETHLGLNGCNSILEGLREKPDVFFISEFWGGLGDIRIEIAKRLKSLQKENLFVIPIDIGMVCTLPNLKIRCSSCELIYPINDIHIKKPLLSSTQNKLQYICKNCTQELSFN